MLDPVSAVDGVKVALVPSAAVVTAPATVAPPGPVRVRWTEDAVTGSEKLAVTAEVVGTAVAALVGDVEVTVGGWVSVAVVAKIGSTQ